MELTPSLSMVQSLKYAIAMWDALVGTSHQHIISNAPVTSSDPPPPVMIWPALHMQHPNFNILEPGPGEVDLSEKELHQLIGHLRLELDLAQLHMAKQDSTIRIYQAQLILSSAHSRQHQKQLQAHEEKHKKKKGNVLIKPNTSKGHGISCEEAEQYEIVKRDARLRRRLIKLPGSSNSSSTRCRRRQRRCRGKHKEQLRRLMGCKPQKPLKPI